MQPPLQFLVTEYTYRRIFEIVVPFVFHSESHTAQIHLYLPCTSSVRRAATFIRRETPLYSQLYQKHVQWFLGTGIRSNP